MTVDIKKYTTFLERVANEIDISPQQVSGCGEPLSGGGALA